MNHKRVSPWTFMTQLFKWNGMDVILMVVDQFSKLAKMVPNMSQPHFGASVKMRLALPKMGT
jgi:hypothetical protein